MFGARLGWSLPNPLKPAENLSFILRIVLGGSRIKSDTAFGEKNNLSILLIGAVFFKFVHIDCRFRRTVKCHEVSLRFVVVS